MTFPGRGRRFPLRLNVSHDVPRCACGVAGSLSCNWYRLRLSGEKLCLAPFPVAYGVSLAEGERGREVEFFIAGEEGREGGR